MLELRQSTAITEKIGPFLDSTNGVTPETGLTILQGNVRLSKNGGNIAQKTEASPCTHDELGYYDCDLDVTDTGTLGRLKLAVNAVGACPVWHDYQVVTQEYWDAKYDATRAANLEKLRKVETNKAVVNADDTQVDVYEDNGSDVAFSFTISSDRKTRTPI